MEYVIITSLFILFCFFLLGFFKVVQLINTLKKSIESKEIEEKKVNAEIPKNTVKPNVVMATHPKIDRLNQVNTSSQQNNQSVNIQNGQTTMVKLDSNSSSTEVDFTVKM
ncbi:hypothetical protein ACFOU2_14820 [Bacillus songklensis]|uniref:Uncharacterized protein n=1 Tax=Bacillus songklensis TaxID=1069116 RepID=A0ABV8B698_9BACI